MLDQQSDLLLFSVKPRDSHGLLESVFGIGAVKFLRLLSGLFGYPICVRTEPALNISIAHTEDDKLAVLGFAAFFVGRKYITPILIVSITKKNNNRAFPRPKSSIDLP